LFPCRVLELSPSWRKGGNQRNVVSEKSGGTRQSKRKWCNTDVVVEIWGNSSRADREDAAGIVGGLD